jgi:kumamolisin
MTTTTIGHSQLKASYTVLRGSERQLIQHSRHIGAVPSNEIIKVSVYLRNPASDELKNTIQQQIADGEQGNCVSHLNRSDYIQRHGADPSDMAKVTAFANEYQLTIIDKHIASRRVILSGTATQLCDAFGTRLSRYERNGKVFRGRESTLQIPEELNGIIESVLGLDNRTQAHNHYRFTENASEDVAYSPQQVAQFYNFPHDVTGQDQCIALIELGGGYQITDLGTTAARVKFVSVDGSTNAPNGDSNGSDSEVELDIEIACAIAPGATIAVYIASSADDRSFVDALNAAIHDTINKPSVISISWGGPEDSWSDQARNTMDQALQAATVLGITVCVASGDSGSSDGEDDGQKHVDFPASDPYVLACGGTRVEATNGKITSEVAWDGATGSTGGGFSTKFDAPVWQVALLPPAQAGAHLGRGVPDIAGNADPSTGYIVRINGQNTSVGGTSAVAPLWAGLIALINQHKGHNMGFLNPLLYKDATNLWLRGALQDIQQGNNGLCQTSKGWDPCTGLGTPNGTILSTLL